MAKHRFRAFTLIELLVVVSIIALLVSILLPALGRAREQTHLVVCQVRLKQLGLGLTMYSQDNEDYFPSRSERGPESYSLVPTPGPTGGPTGYYPNPMSRPYEEVAIGLGKLYPDYLDTGECFYCPKFHRYPILSYEGGIENGVTVGWQPNVPVVNNATGIQTTYIYGGGNTDVTKPQIRLNTYVSANGNMLPLAIDWFLWGWGGGETTIGHKGGAYNMVFPDGSVGTYLDTSQELITNPAYSDVSSTYAVFERFADDYWF